MKKYIMLLLAMAAPMSATSGTTLLTGSADNSSLINIISGITAPDTGDGLSYTLHDTNYQANPFAFAAADKAVDRYRLASADTHYLLVAAAEGGEDLSFLDDDIEILEVFDPLETFNRGMFWFNDKLYFYLMKPVAKVYRFVAPEPFRVAISHAFSNLATPVRMINAGLQGKFSEAGNELVRFGTNTTLGIGGLFDPAKEHFGLARKDEDAGQTMGHYGIGPGPYLVLPFIGPSSFRDGLGHMVDSPMDIMTHLLEHQDYWGSLAFSAINTLSLNKDTYEDIKKDSLDPYLFVRDAWTQYRQNLVEN